MAAGRSAWPALPGALTGVASSATPLTHHHPLARGDQFGARSPVVHLHRFDAKLVRHKRKHFVVEAAPRATQTGEELHGMRAAEHQRAAGLTRANLLRTPLRERRPLRTCWQTMQHEPPRYDLSW